MQHKKIFHKLNKEEIGVLKHGILGLLNYGGMTGYEIMGVFRDSLRFFWTAQTSQIYRELQGMEKRGWVTQTHVPQQGKPDKNLYSITEEGKRELLSWLEADVEDSIRSPLLMKTFFRGELSVDENIDYFKSLMESNVFPEGSDVPAQSAGLYAKRVDRPEKALYWQMTLEFGMMYEQMFHAWCGRCIEALEQVKEERENEHSGD